MQRRVMGQTLLKLGAQTLLLLPLFVVHSQISAEKDTTTGYFGNISKCSYHGRIICKRRSPSFLTIHCVSSRLEIQMSLYAVLVGLGTINHREVRVPWCNARYLKPIFNITVPVMKTLPLNKWRSYHLKSTLQSGDTHIPPDRNILTGTTCPTSYTFFHHACQRVRSEFQFLPPLMEYAQRILEEAQGNRRNITFVGIHVRRQIKTKSESDNAPEYYHMAMEHFRRKYHDIIFVVIADDKNWSDRHLRSDDVYIQKEVPPHPAYNLALAANCNHTIFTYGVYGFWAGYLAAGETIYFKKCHAGKEQHIYAKKYPPSWIGLGVSDAPSVEPETEYDNYVKRSIVDIF